MNPSRTGVPLFAFCEQVVRRSGWLDQVRLIIAGSRTVSPDIDQISAVLRDFLPAGVSVSAVVSGCQRGADRAGERWARAHSLPVLPYPADWERYGNAAGPIRNARMADVGDALLAFWNGKSPGTRNMVSQMRRRGKSFCVVEVR